MIPQGNDSLGGDPPRGRFPWGTIPLGDDSPGGRFPQGKDPPWPNGRGRGSRFPAVAGSNPTPPSCWGSLWCNFWVILGSSWGHFGVTLGSLWGHLGIILGSLWDQFGIILGSCWDRFGINLGSCWDRSQPSERDGRQNGAVARTARLSPDWARQIGASSEARLEVPPGWPEHQNGQNARTPDR